MKQTILQFKLALLCSLSTGAVFAQSVDIPKSEADFNNANNFPTIPGDAMIKSRSNYYRDLNYIFTRKGDGSLYLNEGGWGSSQVDSSGNLIKLISRYNQGLNSSYFKAAVTQPWDLATQPEFQNGFFRLYSNLKLTPTNPTPTTTSSDLKTLRRATANESFPYFNSYAPINGDTIYNWQSWLYPGIVGSRPVDPKTANSQRNAYVNPGATRVYRDYNYATLRDADPSNDLNPNAGDRNFEMDLSASAADPSQIFARINNNRDKMILTIWYGYKPLAGPASKPLADLRISGWDDAYDMKYKLWFNGVAAVVPSSSNTEYTKIRLANNIAQGINNENSGTGADIRAFNSKFDEVSELAEDILSSSTEAAMEMNGLRTIQYNNDIDAYGLTSTTLKLKFRMLSVGMEFNAAKRADRVYNTTFSITERFLTSNANHQTYLDFVDTFETRKINFFHPKHPFGLTPEQYIDIVTTRPSISFGAGEANSSNIYQGTAIAMDAGSTTAINEITLNILEDGIAQLPFNELNTGTHNPTIDEARVRVSLVSKSVYDASNINTNNDLATLPNFAYLTQAQFVALQNTIPAGEYMIKYDYSSPDSKSTIKTEGATLGEIFAKSIYRPLVVVTPVPITLASFTAFYNKGIVALDWSTAMEYNVKHYEVKRSTDANEYATIGIVKANNTPSNYKFEDRQPKHGINYYKIVSVDYNAITNATDVRKVIVEEINQIVVFPNPATDLVTIKNAGKNEIKIISVSSGQVVKTVIGETEDVQFSIKDLSKGLYIIKVADKNLKLSIL